MPIAKALPEEFYAEYDQLAQEIDQTLPDDDARKFIGALVDQRICSATNILNRAAAKYRQPDIGSVRSRWQELMDANGGERRVGELIPRPVLSGHLPA